MSIQSGTLAVLLVILAVLAGGCGGTVIDSAGTEVLVAEEVERVKGHKPDSVDCPSDVDVDPGATYSCTVVVGDKREIATLKIRNEDADLSLIGLSPEQPGGQE